MRPSWGVISWLPMLLLTASVRSHTAEHTPGPELPAMDRLLTRGNIHFAEMRSKEFGFDPGPIDGMFTAQTQAAVRAFQARYGLPMSGLLDRPTHEELKLWVDPKRGD
jgi:murein L,D-transpeptidase YcbB/YkuD